MSFFLCGLVSFLLAFLFTKGWIALSQRRALYQNIREEGPKDHLEKKAHVPTMGGVAIISAVLLATVPFWNRELWIPMGTFLACGLLGVADDWQKFTGGKNLGLKARHKFFGQILIGAGLWGAFKLTGGGSEIAVPFYGSWDAGQVFLPLVILVLVATTNAVNLTDGLDGLAGGVTAIALVFFLVASYFSPVPGYFSSALLGACVGFLWFNGFPARVFMGDSGSLALGGALCALAFQTGLVFWLPVVGGIFVVETLSVLTQVTYFKITKGKRIFKMSPLHHHFELCGVPETQVTMRFWIVTFFLSWFSIIGAVRGF